MIIDDKLKLIFIHIPKTGGTSIHQWLKYQNCSTLSFWGKKDLVDLAHLTLEDANRLIPNFNISYFKFAFIRHPLDRVYSAYLQPYKQLYPTLTFEQFLERFVKKIKTNDGINDYNLVHLWPMYQFLKINNQVTIDFVGRMETWKSDIEFIKSLFLLKNYPMYLNSNKNNTICVNKYGHLYTDVQKNLIYHIYLEDYEIGGYIN